MRDTFEDKLKALLNEDITEPNDRLWDKIESRLEAEVFASCIAQQLDAIEAIPSDTVWAGIEKQLHPASIFRFPKAYYWSAAAALICMISIGIAILQPKKNETTTYLISMELPVMQAPEFTNTDAHIPNPIIDDLRSSVKADSPLKTIDKQPVLTSSSMELQYAIDEIIEMQLPDSLKLQPIQVVEDVYAFQMESPLPREDALRSGLVIEKSTERPGFESAVNYVLKKVMGANRAHLQIEEKIKGKKKVWQVHFDSKLFSVSGAVPYGRIAESEFVKP